MMRIFKNPEWIDDRLLLDVALEDISESFLDEIKDGLAAFQTSKPLVSIVIPVLNEEVSILRTLHSLSRNMTSYATEIIVVNNGCTDRTQEVLDRVNVKSCFQAKPGWGPARQMGQECASGKYVLMADADTFYPPGWIERMTSELMREGVTCVYGGYSFLGAPGKSRWKFFVYEILRNAIGEFRHLRRPWFNCVGMCMGYVRAEGLQVGFVDRKIRGEDGRMCFELSQLGKIVRVRSDDVVVWTFPRTLQKDGTLTRAILNRAVIEMARFGSYFRKQVVHDTHTSANFRPPDMKYFRRTPVEAGDEAQEFEK